MNKPIMRIKAAKRTFVPPAIISGRYWSMLILLTKSFMGSVLKKVCLQNRVSLSLGKKAEGYLTLFNIYGNAHDEELFIKRAIVLEPTILMPTCRVVVCPMYNTAFAIPFVFAIKLNGIASA
jgi:hypothetical protein